MIASTSLKAPGRNKYAAIFVKLPETIEAVAYQANRSGGSADQGLRRRTVFIWWLHTPDTHDASSPILLADHPHARSLDNGPAVLQTHSRRAPGSGPSKIATIESEEAGEGGLPFLG